MSSFQLSLSTLISYLRLNFHTTDTTKNVLGVIPHGVVDNVLDCDIIVSEFKLPSNSYIHFWTNALVKDMNLIIFPCYGLNNTTITLLQGWLWH